MKKTIFSQEYVEIPTYLTGEDEKNPIFFEKRNVQGATGKIFPLAMCNKIGVDYKNVTYNQFRLENEYIDITLLPEIGGRIYSALDKTTGYDFIFKNKVIKPALIGLAGPWVSGGIEFNWPQHHRPSTFKAVDCNVEHNEDGSTTVWMGEIEAFNRTKGMVGITVFPDKSYIQAKIKLFNRTAFAQSFMWWANLAVAVNDNYKAVFPEDIHWASDHAWYLTSSFPVLNGKYKTVDFDNVDVCTFKNMPFGTSFFTYNSNYDFLSGYDVDKDAGIVHIADRHVSPGKKMFTWGKCEFSDAWFKNLSDEDGAYIELMTGVYCCNQPDFSWIMPYEFKTAEQYWYPIRDIEHVKSATLYGAVGYELSGKTLNFAVNTTEKREDCKVIIKHNNKVVHEIVELIAPDKPYKGSFEFEQEPLPHETELVICSKQGEVLVNYIPEAPVSEDVPPPLSAAPYEEEIDSANELFMHAFHMWQYKHAYFDPMDYLERAIELEPTHYDANTLAGRIMTERYMFDKAKEYLQKAVEISTRRNPNPYNTDAYYYLGILNMLMGDYDEAYSNLFRAVWVFANKSSGYFHIAQIDCLRKEYSKALINLEQSINSNATNFSAIKLKAMVLRRLGRSAEAEECLQFIYKHDKLDFVALYETTLNYKNCNEGKYKAALAEFESVIRDDAEYYLDIALDYSDAGFYEEAIDVLEYYTGKYSQNLVLQYYKAYYANKIGNMQYAQEILKSAAALSPVGCLHSRLNSVSVLQYARDNNENDANAAYLLGNMYYGAKRFNEGIDQFKLSIERGANFPTVYRNLAIGCFDKLGEVQKAGELIKKAFDMDKTDSRVLFELIQYMANTNVKTQQRIELMEQYLNLTRYNEDLYAKYVYACMELGDYDKALELLANYEFHPYEGGEGLISRQYIYANLLKGDTLLRNGKAEQALELFKKVLTVPANFNEGKRPILYQEAHMHYYLGLAYEALGNSDDAQKHFNISVADTSLTAEMKYFQARSLEKLGKANEATALYNEMLEDAKVMIASKGRHSYFTKSLVVTLPFEHDLQKNSDTIAYYINGLAYLGLNDKENAKANFEKAKNIKTSMYLADYYGNF